VTVGIILLLRFHHKTVEIKQAAGISTSEIQNPKIEN
jgi:hypothetical protein